MQVCLTCVFFVPQAVQQVLSTLDYDKVHKHLAKMPLQVLSGLLPWPPRTPPEGEPMAAHRVRAHRAPLLLAGRCVPLLDSVYHARRLLTAG